MNNRRTKIKKPLFVHPSGALSTYTYPENKIKQNGALRGRGIEMEKRDEIRLQGSATYAACGCDSCVCVCCACLHSNMYVLIF